MIKLIFLLQKAIIISFLFNTFDNIYINILSKWSWILFKLFIWPIICAWLLPTIVARFVEDRGQRPIVAMLVDNRGQLTRVFRLVEEKGQITRVARLLESRGQISRVVRLIGDKGLRPLQVSPVEEEGKGQ